MTHYILAILIIIYCIAGTRADTEIINFRSEVHSDVPYNSQLGWWVPVDASLLNFTPLYVP